jgi:hypothetical protein
MGRAGKTSAGNKAWTTSRIVVVAGLVVIVLVWMLTPADTGFKQPVTWQKMANPGLLSAAHASLENDCAACHTPVSGVEPENCISCHANNASLLQSQPTAFHVNVASCKECHLEHQGRAHRPTTMDHTILSRVGMRQLNDGETSGEREQVRRQLQAWMRHIGDESLPHAHVTRDEMILNCVTCHGNEDPHVAYFGDGCANCHATNAWNIPQYIHPPSSSTDCAQCHKAPPSHFMPMFMSMCAKMLGKKPDSVKQCYVCHEISAWNDMRGAPWHKKTMSHIPSR